MAPTKEEKANTSGVFVKVRNNCSNVPKMLSKIPKKMSLLGFQNFSQIRINLRGRTAQLPLEHGESQAATKEQG